MDAEDSLSDDNVSHGSASDDYVTSAPTPASALRGPSLERILLGLLAVVVVAVVSLAVAVVAMSSGEDTAGNLPEMPPLDPMVPLPPPVPSVTAEQEPPRVPADSPWGLPTPTPESHVPDGNDVAVVYTNDGFTPSSVTVSPGGTVVFFNASDWEFWPASNIHPTHEIMPEFDSLQPVAAGEAWQHTFDEVGIWYYHDHLSPDMGGVVKVVAAEEPEVGTTEQPPVEASSPPPAEGEPADLEPLVLTMPDREFDPLPSDAANTHSSIFTNTRDLEDFIDRHGLSASLQVLKQIELDTGNHCHDVAHDAGRIAYEEFGSAAFALATHECQSGGLHGATEALFADRGTSRLADDIAVLCDGAINDFIRHQCLHGIGHGLMAWTSYDLPGALGLCDEAIPRDRGSCYSGIFMENVVGGLSGAMGHYTEWLKPDDPVFPCDVVETRYQPDCYHYQTTHASGVLGWDMAAVAAICVEAPENSQATCWSSFGRDVANQAGDDPATAIRLCKNAAEALPNFWCVQGSVQNGFWEPPGAQRAIQYCALLAEDPEAYPGSISGCYEMITRRAGEVLIEPAALSGFCSQIPDGYQASCRA